MALRQNSGPLKAFIAFPVLSNLHVAALENDVLKRS